MSTPDPDPKAPGPGWRRALSPWTLVPAVLLLAASGAGLWLVTTPAGARHSLGWIPGLEVGPLQGSWIEGLKIDRLDWSAAAPTATATSEPGAGPRRVRVEGLELGAPGWSLTASARTWGRLQVDRLSAREVTVSGGTAGGSGPPSLPASLALPVELRLPKVTIGLLRLPGVADPIEDLEAGLELGQDGGRAHRLTALKARWRDLQAEGAAGIATEAPLQLDARLQVGTRLPPAATAETPPQNLLGNPAWQASLRALGPLAGFDLDAVLQSAGQSLTAKALVAPGAAWPLPRLQVEADGLDLAALGDHLPSSRLSGSVRIEPAAPERAQAGAPPLPEVRDPRRQELQLLADVRNTRPLALSAGGLPLASLRAQARVDAADPMAGITIPSFEALLADGAGPAGRIEGRGAWEAGSQDAALRVTGLSLRSIDARWPAMRLTGPMAIRAAGWQQDPASATAEARIDLRGEQTAPTRGRAPVAMKAQITASLAAVQVQELLLQVGNARTEGRLDARRSPVGDRAGAATGLRASLDAARADAWQLGGQLALSGFDPGDWIPAAAGSVWRQRSSRLTGTAAWALQWPAARDGPSGRQTAGSQAAGMTGEATLTLGSGSDLLGVPVQGDASLTRADAAGALLGRVAVDAAGNRLRLELRADPGRLAGRPEAASAGGTRQASVPAPDAGGSTDRMDLVLEADTLSALRPWWRAFAPGAGPSGSDWGGALRLQAQAQGHWPLVRTEGQLRTNGLRVGGLSVARAEGRWQMDPRGGEPLVAELEFQDAARGGQVLDRGRLVLGGTLAEHRVGMEAVARAVPPAWLRLLGQAERDASRDERSRWTIAGTGRWQTLADSGAANSPTAPPADGLHPALSAWANGQATRWTLLDLQAKVAPMRTEGRGPPSASDSAPARGAALPPEWLSLENRGLEIDLPGRAPARADLPPAGSMQLRSGPGLLRSAAATVRWTSFAWRPPTAGRPEHIELDASLDALPIAPLLQRAQPGFGWGGDLVMGGRFVLRPDPDAPRRLQADLRVERVGGDLQVEEGGSPLALGLGELRVFATARDGVWTLGVAADGTRLGSLTGEVRLDAAADSPWPSPASALRGQLTARVADLGVWGAWVPAGWRLGGQLRSELAVSGTWQARRFTGSLQGDQLAVRNPLQGVAVTDGRVVVSLQGDRAVIETARARSGSGSLEITGGTLFAAGGARTELNVVADQFQVLGRVDRRIVASGRSRVRLSPEALSVDGRFGVDEGLIDFSRRDAPTLSQDVVVDGERPLDDAASDVTGPGQSPRLQLALDLQIDLGERLRVRGRGLDTGLRGNLRLSSPANRLALNGTVRTAEGTYAAYGQKLAITRGNVAFSGPPDNPRLDIEATRPDVDVVVGVSIAGPAASPRVRLISEPEMSETDKLSWLMLGRGSDGLGRTDAALLQRAAFALLAGEDGAARDPISALFGLDTLSVRPGDGESSRDTVLTLGKQLNRRWYIGYERGLNATAGNFQLIYRLARRFTLRAQSGEDNSMDLIWTWRWQ